MWPAAVKHSVRALDASLRSERTLLLRNTSADGPPRPINVVEYPIIAQYDDAPFEAVVAEALTAAVSGPDP
jgi:hypothetical protein